MKDTEAYENLINNINVSFANKYIDKVTKEAFMKRVDELKNLEELYKLNEELETFIPNSYGDIQLDSRAITNLQWDLPHPGGGFRPNGFHDGLDFGSAAFPGKNILATHGGEVIFADIYGYGLGAVIVTLSEDGYYVMYQEFGISTANIKVKKGDKVSTGQLIGTRNTTHVHVGVTKTFWEKALEDAFNIKGPWLDPMKIINDGRKPINNKPVYSKADFQASNKADGNKLWSDLALTKQKEKSSSGKVYNVTGTYKMPSGEIIYSLYNQNGTWAGYAAEKTFVKVKYVSFGKEVVMSKKDYSSYSDFFFSKKKIPNSVTEIGTKYIAKGYYVLGNGRKYYSIYQNDKWMGYINANALQLTTYKGLNENVSIAKGNFNLYNDITLKKVRKTTTIGKYYKAKGLHELSGGTKVYSLYNQNGTWAGYINMKNAKTVKYVSFGKEVVITKNGYGAYENFFFLKKKIANSGSQIGTKYVAKGYYILGDGKTFYSIYQGDKWMGYINKDATQLTTYKGVNQNVSIAKGNLNLYNDITLKKVRKTTTIGKYYKATGIHQLADGTKIYSLYNQNGTWAGYTNVKNAIQVKYKSLGKKVVMTKKGYGAYENFFFSKKKIANSGTQIGTKYVAKGYYILGDGKTFYSIYQGDKWMGYINKDAMATYSSKKVNKQVTVTTNKVKLWDDIALNKEKSTTSKGKAYTLKVTYKLSNKTSIGSLYNKNGTWAGYVDMTYVKNK